MLGCCHLYLKGCCSGGFEFSQGSWERLAQQLTHTFELFQALKKATSAERQSSIKRVLPRFQPHHIKQLFLIVIYLRHFCKVLSLLGFSAYFVDSMYRKFEGQNKYSAYLTHHHKRPCHKGQSQCFHFSSLISSYLGFKVKRCSFTSKSHLVFVSHSVSVCSL